VSIYQVREDVVTNSTNIVLCSHDGCCRSVCRGFDDKYSLWLATVYKSLSQSI